MGRLMSRGAAGSGGGGGGRGAPHVKAANDHKHRRAMGKNEDISGKAERAAIKMARDRKRSKAAKQADPTTVFMVFGGVMILIIALVLSDPSSLKSESSAMENPAYNPPGAPSVKIEVVEDTVPEACERKSKFGDYLRMHYRGTLLSGTEFDSSYKRGPFTFQLGAGNVIRGWDHGLQDMCVGEKRKLTIPPHLAYGERGAGGVIPPSATLKFDVELVGFAEGPEDPTMPAEEPVEPIEGDDMIDDEPDVDPEVD